MKVEQAVAKYGKDICERAFKLSNEGEGAKTIGWMLKLTTRQADCAINAGREISNTQKLA
jgi:hypothetical protein